MSDPPVYDGLRALAHALVAENGLGGLDCVCFDLGGEGARRACAAVADAGVSFAAERAAAAVSAALGAAAAGAHPWLFASGDAAVLLSRALRLAERTGVTLTGVVVSHGDDIGAVLPCADATDLAVLAGAPVDPWCLSSESEVTAWARRRAHELRGDDARSSVAVMDLRSVALRYTQRRAPVTAQLDPVETEGEGEVVLISCGAGAQALVAAQWLRSEGVDARAVSVRRCAQRDESVIERALLGARRVVVHESGAGAGRGRSSLRSIVRTSVGRGVAVDVLDGLGPVEAADFCEVIAREERRRSALQAASRALRVQFVGPPATRSATVALALALFSRANILGWAECIEPTHAMLTVDVGPARDVGASGWLVAVPGLPVQAPVETRLGTTAMLVDAGARSVLLPPDRASEHQEHSSLLAAVVVVELELRGQIAALAALEQALGDAGSSLGSMAWVEVRAQADHLRSLR